MDNIHEIYSFYNIFLKAKFNRNNMLEYIQIMNIHKDLILKELCKNVQNKKL